MGSGFPNQNPSLATSIPGIYVAPAAAIVIPAPSFIVGAAGTNPALTLAGILPGDVVIGIAIGNSQFPTSLTGFAIWFNGVQFVSGAYLNAYARLVTPTDTTTITLPTSSAGAYAAAAFRLASAQDGLATLKSGVSALPVSNSFANTIAGDFALNLIGWDVSSGNSDYSVSTGYTLAAHTPAVGGAHFGAAIEFLQLGAAGTVAASSGAALGQSGDWGVAALALYPVSSYA